MKRLYYVLAAFALSFAAGEVWADPPVTQSACRDLPRPFIAVVPEPARKGALGLLGSKQLVPLTDQEAAEMLGEPAESPSFAVARLDRAISQLNAEHEVALKGEGSWNLARDQELAELIRLRSSVFAKIPRPFLVRAVMGFEGTGTFFASQCGDILNVTHGSLGRSNPRPQSVPVIVLLGEAPGRVHADYSVAE